MNMHLAAILGLWLLTNSSIAAGVFPVPGMGSAQESPPQAESPQAPPAQQPAQNPQSGSPAQQAQQPSPEAAGKKPPSTAKPAAKKRRRRKHVAAKPGSTPEKKVVRNGGTADPVGQLAPVVSNEQATRQRQSTSQLLATTDTNLKQLASRQLSVTQQASVSQIRKYMEQAKAADDAGDVQRAQNLASKALMLSDDLMKH